MKKKYIALMALPLLCGCSSNTVLWESASEEELHEVEPIIEYEKNIGDGVFRTDKTILSYMPEEKGCRFKQIYGYVENEKYRETDVRELFIDTPCAKFDFKNYAEYLKEKRVKRLVEPFEKYKDDKMLVSFQQKGRNCIIDFSAGVVEDGKYLETDVKQVTFGSRECRGIVDDFIVKNSNWIDEKNIKQPVENGDFWNRKRAGKTDKSVVSLKQEGNSCVYSRSYGWSLNGKFTETDSKQIKFGNTQCDYVRSLVNDKKSSILKDEELEGEMNLKPIKKPWVI
ncbi:MAG TPA: hypothetical protein DD624_01815 [Alphaproteobacteria bacterium]|nr:hypothetical protein [Alphaproteobacteria bacterium]